MNSHSSNDVSINEEVTSGDDAKLHAQLESDHTPARKRRAIAAETVNSMPRTRRRSLRSTLKVCREDNDENSSRSGRTNHGKSADSRKRKSLNEGRKASGAEGSPRAGQESNGDDRVSPEASIFISRSERKRVRERKRRSDFKDAFESLLSVLVKVDPVFKLQVTDRQNRRAESRDQRIYDGDSVFSRVDLLNKTISCLERFYDIQQKGRKSLLELGIDPDSIVQEVTPRRSGSLERGGSTRTSNPCLSHSKQETNSEHKTSISLIKQINGLQPATNPSINSVVRSVSQEMASSSDPYGRDVSVNLMSVRHPGFIERCAHAGTATIGHVLHGKQRNQTDPIDLIMSAHQEQQRNIRMSREADLLRLHQLQQEVTLRPEVHHLPLAQTGFSSTLPSTSIQTARAPSLQAQFSSAVARIPLNSNLDQGTLEPSLARVGLQPSRNLLSSIELTSDLATVLALRKSWTGPGI